MITLGILGILFIGAFSVYFFIRSKKKTLPLPPGPKGLPFFGNVFQLGRTPHLVYAKWAKKYGEIYSTKLLTTSMFIVNDPNLVREIFHHQTFTGRFKSGDEFDLYSDGSLHGILNSEGEEWEQLRRFTIRTLRDFGFGKSSMEDLIMEEVKETLERMKRDEGKPTGNIKEELNLPVVNALWRIISGQRNQHDDPKLMSLTKKTTEAFKDLAETGSILLFVPWLKYIIPEWSGYKAMRKLLDNIKTLFSGAVTEHKDTYSEDHQRDFIDVFLKEIKHTSDPKNKAFFGEMGEKQLVAVIADLFGGGSNTTSSTLAWTLLYLATFPEIQKKFQEEIETVVGNSRHCSLKDRTSMPYTEALISEILRYSSIVPNGIPHRALSDARVKGHFIPKDTIIIPNIYYIHFDPKIWGDPETFRPERFLSSDGKAFKKNEALIPFSVEKRQCLGESLAKDTLFLFVTNIFQKFTVSFDPSEPNPGLEAAPGLFLEPKPFKVVLTDKSVEE